MTYFLNHMVVITSWAVDFIVIISALNDIVPNLDLFEMHYT